MIHQYIQTRAKRITLLTALTMLLANDAWGDAETLHDAFHQGSVSGHVRTYLNNKNPKPSDSYSTFAGGLGLHGETAPLHGVSTGATFYSSNDFGWQNSNPAKRNTNLPEDVTVVGEAWLQYQFDSTRIRAGRQKINTPFANSSDAFLIPITFEAASITNTAIDGLSLSGHYLKRIKNRPVENFETGSQFALNRYGIAADSDSGTWLASAQYQTDNATWQGWVYGFGDLFNLYYGQMDYRFSGVPLKPGLGLQLMHAADSGDALLGDVDTNGGGLKVSAGNNLLTATLAWSHFLSDEDSFQGGALPAPYNFSTGPTYTNSMTQTLENSAAGDAYKASLKTNPGSHWSTSISYGKYQRLQAVDTSETDLDITYQFDGAYRGLSLRLRLALVDSNEESARFTETRTQLQYTF